MRWPHPSQRRLERWMHDPVAGPTERHLAGCDRCSGQLDLGEGPQEVDVLMGRLIAPPPDAAPFTVDQARDRERRNRYSSGALLVKLLIWLESGTIPPNPEAGQPA